MDGYKVETKYFIIIHCDDIKQEFSIKCNYAVLFWQSCSRVEEDVIQLGSGFMYNRDLTKTRQDRLTSEIYRHLFTNTFAFA